MPSRNEIKEFCRDLQFLWEQFDHLTLYEVMYVATGMLPETILSVKIKEGRVISEEVVLEDLNLREINFDEVLSRLKAIRFSYGDK